MDKRGQITVFIILGIFLVLAVMLFIFYTSSSKQKTSPEIEVKRSTITALDSSGIKGFVQDCLKLVTNEGLRKTALQGGYINAQGNPTYNEPGDGLHGDVHYYTETAVLPYAYIEQQSRLRPIELIRAKLANYIVVEMQNCLDFEGFEKQNYQVKKPGITRINSAEEQNGVGVDYLGKKAKAEVFFNDEDTVVRLSYPLVFTRGETSIRMEDFSAVIPLRFKHVHAIAEKLLSQDLSQEYELNRHCAEYASPDKLINIYVRTNPYNYNYVVQVIDAKPAVEKNVLPLKFQFATRNAKISGDCVG